MVVEFKLDLVVKILNITCKQNTLRHQRHSIKICRFHPKVGLNKSNVKGRPI